MNSFQFRSRKKPYIRGIIISVIIILAEGAGMLTKGIQAGFITIMVIAAIYLILCLIRLTNKHPSLKLDAEGIFLNRWKMQRLRWDEIRAIDIYDLTRRLRVLRFKTDSKPLRIPLNTINANEDFLFTVLTNCLHSTPHEREEYLRYLNTLNPPRNS